MITRCSFGIHKYALNDEVITGTETWYRNDGYGMRIPDSDFTRHRRVKVEKCMRCGKKKAYRYLDNYSSDQWEELTVEFAEAEIARVRGNNNANPIPPKD